ncbi:hypothetical protein F4818DRAFT_438511 [Hypoxylon cercidicola]|nr:hypothetical protein F4818DRAFT_438511 [Hypoxylon cercidicola]
MLELLKLTLYRIFKVGIVILIERMLVKKIRAHITASCTLFDFTPDQEPTLRRLIERDEDDPVSQHQLILESYHAVFSTPFGIRIQGLPPTCMVLSTVIDGKVDGGPTPTPCGTACLEYSGMTPDDYEHIRAMVNQQILKPKN